jgi:hypothetical protein
MAVPAGEPFIAKVSEPFRLDFSRNRIYVVDWAHGSSPPPGMPFGKGGDALADYLLSNSIRYMVYEHGRDDWYPNQCRNMTAPVLNGKSGEYAFECLTGVAMANFLRDLDQLMVSRATIFDDGQLAVLSLDKHLRVD